MQIYKFGNLTCDVKNITYSMIKSSNKKSFKKDIHILKVQGNSKYCKQHGDSKYKDCYVFGPIGTNRNFTENFYLRNIAFLIIIFSSWVTESQHGFKTPRRP